MKTASLKEIKKELETMPPEKLLQYCLQLIKYKKENKELLSYILFDEGDEATYVANIKNLLADEFGMVHPTSWYFGKKTLRKIIRTTNKYIGYSSQKTTEVELLLHICTQINSLPLKYYSYYALDNMYNGVLKKIKKTVSTLHEDEQYDYLKQIAALEIG